MRKITQILVLIFILPFANSVDMLDFQIPDSRIPDWDVGVRGGIPDTSSWNVIDVTQPPYNAAGDNVTNDYDAIQNAINDAPNNSIVYLPAGNYYVNPVLYLKSNVVLKGDGPENTSIRIFRNPGTDSIGSWGTNFCGGAGIYICGTYYAPSNPTLTNAGIENLKAEFDFQVNINGPDGYQELVKIRDAENIWIKDCELYRGDHKILLIEDSRYVTIQGTHFHTVLYHEDFANRCQYMGPVYCNNPSTNGYGVNINNATDNLVTNNVFTDLYTPVVFSAETNRNVISYNYSIPTQAMRFGLIHGENNSQVLFEGNHANGFINLDNWWGGEGTQNVIYRNRLLGSLGSLRTEENYDGLITTYMSVLGNIANNVIGIPGCEVPNCHDYDGGVNGGSTQNTWAEKNRYVGVFGRGGDEPTTTYVEDASICTYTEHNGDPRTCAGFFGPQVTSIERWRGLLSTNYNGRQVPSHWNTLNVPTSLYLSSAPDIWCQETVSNGGEACDWDAQSGIGAFGDDLDTTLCKLPAQINYEISQGMGGTCTPIGFVAECENASDCSDRVCNSKSCVAGSCTYNPIGSDPACTDDGSYCNGTESCSAGSCVSSGDPCSGTDVCNESSDSCDPAPDCTTDLQCDDGNECTDDNCSGGTCSNPNSSSGTTCTGGTCDGTGSCISSGCSTSTTSWQNFPIDAQTGIFSVEFDAVPNSSGIDGLTGLSEGNCNGYSCSAVTVRFNIDGEIDAWDETVINPHSGNPGWYSSITPITYIPGETYKFRIVVDVESDTFDAYVSVLQSLELTIANDRAYRSPVSVLDRWHLQSSIGTHDVCNFIIKSIANSGDLNNDLVVDIFDLVIIGKNFNTTVGPNHNSDTNDDEECNIVDLLEVAQNFGTVY